MHILIATLTEEEMQSLDSLADRMNTDRARCIAKLIKMGLAMQARAGSQTESRNAKQRLVKSTDL